MIKRVISISLSYVGLIVGAGFASGQEITQYFVAFGYMGIIGAIITAIAMMVAGVIVLEWGSYIQAREHISVFNRIAHPILAKIFDLSVIITLFATGMVMMAGGGSSLKQQFNIPIFWGSFFLLILVLIVGMLDVDKVAKIIGAVTPFLIIFLLVATIYTYFTVPDDLSHIAQAASQIETTLPHWLVSTVNYSGLVLMVGVSMTIVIGGDNLRPREVGIGGLIGGGIFGLLLVMCTVALYFKVDRTLGDDMPMLTLVTEIHPKMGIVMALIAYAMIFNTAVGMFYSLSKRLTANNPQKFRPVFIITTIAGFGCGFFGFKNLVSYVYPILGYIGVALFIVFCISWIGNRDSIKEESHRRGKIYSLLKKLLDPRKKFNKHDHVVLMEEVEKSNIDNEELADALLEEAREEVKAEVLEETDLVEDEVEAALDESMSKHSDTLDEVSSSDNAVIDSSSISKKSIIKNGVENKE